MPNAVGRIDMYVWLLNNISWKATAVICAAASKHKCQTDFISYFVAIERWNAVHIAQHILVCKQAKRNVDDYEYQHNLVSFEFTN